MFVFPLRLVKGDFVPPASESCTRAAARLPGWTAARRGAAKERPYRRVSSGLPLCPCRLSRSGALGPLRCRCFVPRGAGRGPGLSCPSAEVV
jgi:hypothetical protein